jgi:hypothetical protein
LAGYSPSKVIVYAVVLEAGRESKHCRFLLSVSWLLIALRLESSRVWRGSTSFFDYKCRSSAASSSWTIAAVCLRSLQTSRMACRCSTVRFGFFLCFINYLMKLSSISGSCCQYVILSKLRNKIMYLAPSFLNILSKTSLS